VQQVHRLSQRRVAGLIPVERMTLRYLHHRDPQEVLRVRLREVAGSRVRYGYRRLTCCSGVKAPVHIIWHKIGGSEEAGVQIRSLSSQMAPRSESSAAICSNCVLHNQGNPLPGRQRNDMPNRIHCRKLQRQI